ncbi:nucleotidyl transferase AbiEii/AbiGii toxin family protein [Algoriphagus namhaensis]
MMRSSYRRQVALLLTVLPEVAKEACFGLHGGTAINLFLRNMPRLSVDIDSTYIPIENRETSLAKISEALLRIKFRLEKILFGSHIFLQAHSSKLLISFQGAQVKVEVNQTNRGVLRPLQKFTLCQNAQEEFDAFCTVSVVDQGQLFGGKICAALDRQHPRDLFDIQFILQMAQLDENEKAGLFLALLSSARPLEELINPN